MRYVLFTDAASYNNGQKDPDKPQHSYSGAILTQDGKVIKKFGIFNPNTTNNYGEIYAIYYGLRKAMKYLDSIGETYYEIDVYSDSEICVRGLNEWIFNWKRNAKKGVWYSSSNAKVANQSIFKSIDMIKEKKPKFKKLFKNFGNPDRDIRIFHIKGHVDLSKSKDVAKATKTFKRVNGVDVPFKVLEFLVNMNNKVDRYAVKKLKESLGNHSMENW